MLFQNQEIYFLNFLGVKMKSLMLFEQELAIDWGLKKLQLFHINSFASFVLARCVAEKPMLLAISMGDNRKYQQKILKLFSIKKWDIMACSFSFLTDIRMVFIPLNY